MIGFDESLTIDFGFSPEGIQALKDNYDFRDNAVVANAQVASSLLAGVQGKVMDESIMADAADDKSSAYNTNSQPVQPEISSGIKKGNKPKIGYAEIAVIAVLALLLGYIAYTEFIKR